MEISGSLGGLGYSVIHYVFAGDIINKIIIDIMALIAFCISVYSIYTYLGII